MNVQQAARLRELLSSTTTLWIGLGIALIVLAVLMHRVRAWYRDGDDPADASDEIVRQMEELKRRGDLSDEEFRSIKSQFSGRKDQ